MTVAWIAVDWGTSHLRVLAIDAAGKTIARKSSNHGMGSLAPPDYEQTLLTLIAPWLNDDTVTDVMCCGMVGARQGWIEVPYHTAPCPPVNATSTQEIETQDQRIRVLIISGICQKSPADVMRGEETQIAGFLADRRSFSGMLCLPGTHSKWVHISGGEITHFKTHMTGELFQLLTSHSILQHSMVTDNWSDTDFKKGVIEGYNNPGHVVSNLFALRAEHLIADLAPTAAKSYLSGTLIGQELSIARGALTSEKIALIGADALADKYQLAMEIIGVSTEIFDVEKATISGLGIARDLSRKAD